MKFLCFPTFCFEFFLETVSLFPVSQAQIIIFFMMTNIIIIQTDQLGISCANISTSHIAIGKNKFDFSICSVQSIN